jgi:hypothetical protein
VQGRDEGAVVSADVDVARLVHRCCCEDEVTEGGLEVRDWRRRDQIRDLKSSQVGEVCCEMRY